MEIQFYQFVSVRYYELYILNILKLIFFISTKLYLNCEHIPNGSN